VNIKAKILKNTVDSLTAVAIASAVYALLLLATYLAMVFKSPPGYKKPTKKELAVIALIVAVFFAGAYLLVHGLR